MASDNGHDLKTEELTAVIREIQQRVRARHPSGSVGAANIVLPDLTPILRARDGAQAKVAAIGTVNPRPPGWINNLVQSVKRRVARALNWYVRDQVEFNRATLACVESIIEAMNESNRALAQISAHFSGQFDQLRIQMQEVEQLGEQFKDMRSSWAQWRVHWEQKLSENEIQFLRSVADQQAGFQYRVTLMEANFRDSLNLQHSQFTGAMEKSTLEIQQRLWKDLESIRLEYEGLIHRELRLVRQRVKLQPQALSATGLAESSASATAREDLAPNIDWLQFAERFRGSEEHVKQHQRRYVERFAGCSGVLDIGCGRGEFLEVIKEAQIDAYGIDLSDESVALCVSKGLNAEKADLFQHLEALAEGSLGGIFCAQVIEHLDPAALPRLVKLAALKLRTGAPLVIETPNPECLAIFATHFYLDPTHTRPVPAALMFFYLEESGFERIEVERLYPAADSIPSVNNLTEDFRAQFFGGMDYVVCARKR